MSSVPDNRYQQHLQDNDQAKKLTFLLGGGENKEWTPAEAADWFAEKYLPDLKDNSVRFPAEWLYSGCSIQTPDLPPDQLKRKLDGEKKNGEFIANRKGDDAEKNFWIYLSKIPATSRTALFFNYNVSMFKRFTGQKISNQEFDAILIFAKYKILMCIEIKAGEEGGKGWTDQLKKNEEFLMKEVLPAAGVDTTDWKPVLVGAFPNAENQSKVIIKL